MQPNEMAKRVGSVDSNVPAFLFSDGSENETKKLLQTIKEWMKTFNGNYYFDFV